MGLGKFDAFAKPIEGLRTRTAAGGAITVLAASFSGILFLSQVFLYLQVETRHSFHLAESISHPLESIHQIKHGKRRHNSMNNFPIHLHVTFPHVSCDDLEFALDDSRRNELNVDAAFQSSGERTIIKRRPTRADLDDTPYKHDNRAAARNGCTVIGSIKVPPVGGSLAVTISADSWQKEVAKIPRNIMDQLLGGLAGMMEPKFPTAFNVSHHIHSISFGVEFPLVKNPLKGSTHAFQTDNGIGLSSINLKVIPTKYKRFARRAVEMHQVAATQHMVEAKTLAVQGATVYPGLLLSYDFSPLMVHHTERRENIFLFLSGLISIVGGVFVLVGMLGSLLVNAAEIAKKKD